MTSNPHKPFYLAQLLKEIKATREASFDWRSEWSENSAHGMIIAGYNLRVLDREEYDRLWDLASNAGQFRRHELHNNQPVYTWKEQPTVAQEAAA